jgi:hypothetical protein
LARLKFLDLCCGLGGWSLGFYRAGFDCTGIDIIDIGYPYRLVLADVCSWSPSGEKFDVMAASPPCTEWSQLTRLAIARGQRGPRDIRKAIELVKGCLRIIDEVKPRFWVLENVHGSEEYIVPFLGKPKLKRGPWRLWGEFPPFLLPENPETMRKLNSPIGSIRTDHDKVHDRLNSVFAYNPLRSWFRAKIPIPLSVPMAVACRKALRSR